MIQNLQAIQIPAVSIIKTEMILFSFCTKHKPEAEEGLIRQMANQHGCVTLQGTSAEVCRKHQLDSS
jgi:hypothetical protein